MSFFIVMNNRAGTSPKNFWSQIEMARSRSCERSSVIYYILYIIYKINNYFFIFFKEKIKKKIRIKIRIEIRERSVMNGACSIHMPSSSNPI